MTNKKQKLELTWIGKDEELKLEPRILIEDPDKSYGDSDSENLLIHGDNLLALKALEQDFSEKINCIYIDPPFNTGAAFEHYDDGLEHSIWLSLMQARLVILKKLLSPEGLIFIEIDTRELHYLKVLMDEIFGRFNYRNSIIIKKGVKSVSKQFETVDKLNNAYDSILVYSKNPELKIPNLFKYIEGGTSPSWNNHWRGTDRPTMRYELFGTIPTSGQWRWEKRRTDRAVQNYKTLIEFIRNNETNTIEIDDALVDQYYLQYLEFNDLDSKEFELVRLSSRNKPEHYIPASSKVLMSENWMDLPVAGRITDFEHEKNELILHRIFSWVTKPNDYILDSFLGSGTTAAVAHKMKRKWIGIELGEHANTHCLPRLKKIVDGSDETDLAKLEGWKGGGGFKFYNLAPSLLRKDSFGNFVIDEKYNANMLAAAMCKHEGFKYSPDEASYWKQGKSTETDYIFVTTGFVTVEQLDAIHAQMKENESLLICAKSYAPESENHFPNITVKKIPQMILGKCEFGKDNYDLNIIQATEEQTEELNDESNEQ